MYLFQHRWLVSNESYSMRDDECACGREDRHVG